VLACLFAGIAAVCAEEIPRSQVRDLGHRNEIHVPARVRTARRFLARRGVGDPTLAAKTETRRGWGTRIPTWIRKQKQVLRFAQDDNFIGSNDDALPLASGAAVWTAAGPVGVNSISYGLVSGRVSAIALDPSDATGNTVYAGTTGGGLWKSQNAAATTASSVVFLPVTDGLGALSGIQGAGVSVGAVTVQPGGTGVVLAGLGDPNDALDSYYGAGILRSTDGGKTWSLIQQTVDLESLQGQQDYSFLGEGFAGFAWSTTNVQLVVAAVSQAYEGAVVGAGVSGASYEGLYFSNDSGATWHLARITDRNGQDVQGPLDPFAYPDGNAATSVVWNPVRRVFVAAVRYHGYYQSSDGMTWTQMAPASQPGTGFTAGNCPTEAGSIGVAGCPIFRGSLAVNPQTGDTFAWTVDAFNQDQGIWQDRCGLSGTACTNQTLAFGVQLNTAALETPGLGGDATILNGDYNLTLAAVPGGLGTGQDTLLFAGNNDLWKCSLANSCVWRNTTNATTCMSAKVGEYEHGFAWDTGNPLLVFAGTDSGLWRSTDQVGETGTVCSAGDATHFQNLNGGLGSLAEVASLAQSSTTAATMLAGLGANGTAGVVNAPATAENWNEVLGGEGGPVAIDPTSHGTSWYVNNSAGVSIFQCSAAPGVACTAAGFGALPGGAGPVIGETHVGGDGLAMPYPAEFGFDALDPTQLLIGTCRVWRGPATGAGWSGANAVSPVLDGTGPGGACAGNSLIRSITSAAVGAPSGGGEVIYVGMAGAADGGGVVAGHVFSATVTAAGSVGSWTDLGYSPVVNSGLGFNAFGEDVSALVVDPHDTTGQTVYATVAGFDTPTATVEQVYRTTDGGQHWTGITANLPNAPANGVVVDTQDPNTVYVATDTGVFVTRAVSNCGVSACWSAYGTGLPLVPVTQLIGTPTGAASLVLTAGTYGRGVWQIPLASAGVTLTAATVSPTSLTFANTTVGVTTTSQTVTLKNTGTTTLTVTSVGMTGVAAGDFSETDTCKGVAVAKGASCTLKATFTPTQAGSRTAVMAINANVAGGQLGVALSGTGVATANVTLLPSSVDFGAVQVGVTSTGQTFNVQNVGGSPVTISSIVVTAPFLKSASTCGSSLAAGTGCAVTVTFLPTQAGAAAGSLTVKDSVGSQAAVLNGTGVTAPTDTLSATSLTFPSTVAGQVSAPMTVTISNTGGQPLTGIGTSVASSPAGDFAAVSNCGGTLAAGSSCGVSVTFAPTTTKAETGTLTISDALKAQAVTLKGTGLRAPALTLSKTAVNFGSEQMNVPDSPVTLTITNSGGAPMAQPGFSISGPGAVNFGVGTTTCGATLAAAATCTVNLNFTPLVAGAVTATLTVATSTVGVTAATASLTGVGLTPPMLGVQPAQLDLGTVLVGNSSALFTVQVTNLGQVALAGLSFSVGGLSTGAQPTDFALSAPTDVPACTFPGTTGTLNPGASCNIQVTFSPSFVGTETATLTVAGGNAIPGTTTVSLSGVGAPQIVLQGSVGQLSFSPTVVGASSAAQMMTISNLGRQIANGLTFSLTGPYGISPTQTTCPTTGKGTLAGKSSCTVALVFTPKVSGDQAGTLTVSVTNQGVASVVVPLDGIGVGVGGLTLSPTQMTFGSVVVKASSAMQTLAVTNSGQAALAGVQVQATGDYSLTGNTCAGTLAVGAGCTTGVVFTPAATGIRTGTLTISTTSTGVTPGVVALTGNGIPGGALTASPTVVNFGSVTVGQTSPAQTVTLTNAGATTLGGLTLALTGDYSLPQSNCGAQLASGGTCSFTVNFSPGQPGTRIGSVTVGSTNAGFTPVVVGLTGTGLAAAQLVVAPPQLTFGSIMVGSNSVALQLTVTNPGTGALTGLLLQTAAPFSVGTGTCGALLAAGGTCGAPVVFSPTVSGSQSGLVTISSTSLGVPAVTVPISGTGVAPASLRLNPTALTFSGTTVGTQSAGQTVTVSNPGGVALAGLAVNGSGDFLVSSSSCTGSLAGGGNCTVAVSFTPTVAGGRTGFLTASSTTAGVAPASASLSGTGLTAAVLGMTPDQLSFPATPIGTTSATQTTTVANSGQSTIADLQVGVTAGFLVDTAKTTCTGSLAGGASCVVGVAFIPTAKGTVTGAVTASSAAAKTTATVALNGLGAVPPGITAIPGLVQFGTTGVGTAGQPVTVSFTNTGTATAVTGLALGMSANGTSNGFGLSANNCGTAAAKGTLQPGASCTASVTFEPTLPGALTGTLMVTSDNGGSLTGVALAGIGFDFHFTALGSSTGTVVQGQTAYYKMAVTPLGGTSGGVTFACGKLPAKALCVFNPGQLSGLKAAGDVQLGIGTGKATVAAVEQGAEWGKRMLAICAVLMLPLGWWRRRYAGNARVSRMLLLAGLLGAVVSGVSSCAGAGGTGSLSNTTGGTPAGSYTVMVTASSAGVSHSLQVKLVVN